MAWKIPPEHFRINDPRFGLRGDPFGVFQVQSPDKSRVTKTFLMIIASPGTDEYQWEHVSVRADKQFNGKWRSFIPTWQEMCFVKSLFWDDEDVVMQLHPKKSEYINNHPCVLHLWRPTFVEIPTPPSILVGV